MIPVKPRSNGKRKIDGGAWRMLQQLGLVSRARTQLATLSGMSPRSGTFATYLSQLRSTGFIEKNGDMISITRAGMDYLGNNILVAPRSQDELVEFWCSKLDGRAKDMLRVVVRSGMDGVRRQALADEVELSAQSGTFATYLSQLRSNGLIEKHGGFLRATSVLL
jgi:predicted transcriptional regulator